MGSDQKETLDEGSTSGKFPVAKQDNAAHEEAQDSFSRRLERLGLPRASTDWEDGTLYGGTFEERLPLVWLLHEVLHCCQVSAQVTYLKENRAVTKKLWSACEHLGNHCSGSLPNEKRQAFATFLAMLLLRLTSRSRTHRTPNPSQASPSKEEERKEASRTAIRLLLLKRQQLLLRILLWNIDHPRVQQAWSTIASSACICGHGDAICADANIDHMLAFGKLAMAALSERLHACGLQGEWQDRDAASACLTQGCIMAAEAINTAVSAIYNSEAHSADPDAEFEPSRRVQELLTRAAGLARYPDLEHMLTRLAEPLMVQLVQSILQLQALPILLLDLDSTPPILDVFFRSPDARYSFQSMLRTKLAQLGSQQECFLRRDSQPRLRANGHITADQDASGTLRGKVLHSMKLLLIVIKLAEALDNDTIWEALQKMLMEGHSDHAQEQLRLGELTSTTFGSWSGSSLLQAVACCYKGYLSIVRKETQAQRKAHEDAQHLARLSRSRTFATKSYRQHQAEAQQGKQQLQTFGGSDLVASLIARILARLVTPSCLPEAARILMLDSGLPEAVLAATDEAGCFDHCEILMKAMMKCGCQTWLPADHESSLPLHLGTMAALLRSRDEEIEAIKSRCQQQAEDARLAKKAQREEQSRAQIQAAEEAQAHRAAEEAQRRKDAAAARQAIEMRRAREHQEALKRKTEQLAKQEAAKKAKATEAAESRAGKAIPQAPPEQMGSLAWISCLVPGGMLQMGQGQRRLDAESVQIDWDEDSRDNDGKTHQDCDIGLEGPVTTGSQHSTETMAAQAGTPSSGDSHGHAGASSQPNLLPKDPSAQVTSVTDRDLTKAAGQAAEGLMSQEEAARRAAHLSRLQHRQAAEFSRSGIGDSLQSHPLPDEATLSSPGAVQPLGSEQRPAGPYTADQDPAPATLESASGSIVAGSSGKQTTGQPSPEAGASQDQCSNAVRPPRSDLAEPQSMNLVAAEGQTGPAAAGVNPQTAAAQQEVPQPDPAVAAEADKTVPHLSRSFDQDGQEGPMLHDSMLWVSIELPETTNPAVHPGRRCTTVNMRQPNAPASSSAAPPSLTSDQSPDLSKLQTARQAPFGRHDSSPTREIFGLQAARGQEALPLPHPDAAAKSQLCPTSSSQPLIEGNPFGNAGTAFWRPDSCQTEEAALQHVTGIGQQTGRTSDDTYGRSPAGSQHGAQKLPADSSRSDSHPSGSTVPDADSSQPIQCAGSSKQSRADVTVKHAEQTGRAAKQGRQRSKGNLLLQPLLHTHDAAELFRDSPANTSLSQGQAMEPDKDAGYQASALESVLAGLTSMMGAPSLSDSPSKAQPMEPPHNPADALVHQETSSEPRYSPSNEELDDAKQCPDGNRDQHDPHEGRHGRQHGSFSSPARHPLLSSAILQNMRHTGAGSSNACQQHSASPRPSSLADDGDDARAHEPVHGQLQGSFSSSNFSDDGLPGSPSQAHASVYYQLSSGSSLSFHEDAQVSPPQHGSPSTDMLGLIPPTSGHCRQDTSFDEALREVDRWHQTDLLEAAEPQVYLPGHGQLDGTREAPEQHSSVELHGHEDPDCCQQSRSTLAAASS